MVTAVTNFGRSGLADWVMQRVTAVVLLAYVIFLGGEIFCSGDLTYAAWKALFSHTWVRVFSLAALLSIGAHAWIGMWCVSTDYFTERLMGPKGNVIRLVFQAGVALVLFTYVVWGIQILWG